MKHTTINLVIAYGFFSCAATQTAPFDASLCVPGSGVTAFHNCNSFAELQTICPTSLAKADRIDCFCNQKVFDIVVECGNEERLCFGNGDTDNQIQDALSDWHEGCDSQINFTVTTPALSTITVPYDPKFCTKVISWCASGSVEQQKCVTSYAAVSDQSSCYCAPKLLSLDYSCMYLNNASCVLTPAALSNMPAYGFCSNFQSVLGSLTDITAQTTDFATSFQTTSLLSSLTVARPTVTASSTTPTNTSAADSVTINVALVGKVSLLLVAFLTFIL